MIQKGKNSNPWYTKGLIIKGKKIHILIIKKYYKNNALWIQNSKKNNSWYTKGLIIRGKKTPFIKNKKIL